MIVSIHLAAETGLRKYFNFALRISVVSIHLSAEMGLRDSVFSGGHRSIIRVSIHLSAETGLRK